MKNERRLILSLNNDWLYSRIVDIVLTNRTACTKGNTLSNLYWAFRLVGETYWIL